MPMKQPVVSIPQNQETALAPVVCGSNPWYCKRNLDIQSATSLYAFDDLCSCSMEACPLSGGLLTGTTIMCQCHGSRFDIITGAVVNGPANEALNVYEVHEAEGSIRIRA